MTSNIWNGIRSTPMYGYAVKSNRASVPKELEPEKEEKSLSDAVREKDWEGVVAVVKHLEKRNARLEKELEFYKSSDRALNRIKEINRRESFRHAMEEYSLKNSNEQLVRINKELKREVARLKKLGVFPWTEKPDTINYSSNRFGDLDMVSPAEALEHKHNSEGDEL